jgi:molecular chaperone DnaK
MNQIVGIDLGTTFSAIARLNSVGRPEISPLGDGERITPSAIYFDESKTLVGESARYKSQVDASRYVEIVKRYMGDDYFPRDILGKKWTPSDLSSIILRKIAQDFESQYGPIETAIITVPAYFDEKRRKATMDAALKAELNIAGIVNEPTAAGLYYATVHNIKGKTLVFDLGGGTFDVTLLDVKEAGKSYDVQIITSQGDHQLGGKDFDMAIMKDINKKYEALYGNQLLESKEKEFQILSEAEIIKKELSQSDQVKRVIYGNDGPITYELSATDFELLIAPYFAKIEMLIENLVEDAGLKFSQVDQIVLAGGSSRIPLVKKTISKIFGKDPLKVGNLDESVALGAAIYAGLQAIENGSGEFSEAAQEVLNNVHLTDVANHSYGTLIAKEGNYNENENSFIIPKNTPIPVEITKTFYTISDNQTKINLTVTQGESVDPYGVNILSQKEMDIPGNRPAGQPVEVTYSYDKNQRMKCVFHDVNSGYKETIELSTDPDQSAPSENLDDFVNF